MSGKRITRGPEKFLDNAVEVLGAQSRGEVGEGIQTEAERHTLQALVAPWGRGFHMGPPENIASVTGPISKVR